MAKQKRFHYQVSGQRPFPIDMLRYDRAFPAHEEDSHLIESTMRYENENKLTVSIVGMEKPNEARWRSMGWQVQPGVEVVMLMVA